MKVVKHGINGWKKNEILISVIRNDVRISSLEFRIMDTLLRCNVNKYFPTMSRMAKQLGVSSITIKRGIKKLKQIGYIEVIHLSGNNDNNNTEIHVHSKPINK